MSQKFGNLCNAASISALLLSLLFWAGCDPCYQLARAECECILDETSKKLCLNNLGLAREHKYFKNAQETEVCEKALRECTCEEFNDEQDEKCGLYRPAPASGKHE